MVRDDMIERQHGHTSAYIAFGRFQPPTIGHGILLRNLLTSAIKTNGDAYVFVTSTLDGNKNPLNVSTKVSWLKTMFSHTKGQLRIINTTTCPQATKSTPPFIHCETGQL